MSAMAQTKISGNIVSDKHIQLDYCNILVLQPSDSAFLYGEVILNGQFELKVSQTNVLLKIEVLGFTEKYIEIKGSSDLGEIVLVTNELSTVEVTGQKLPFESQNGNTKINVSNSIFQSSASVQELLSKSPGIIITSDGISVIGRGQALIYLDRKQISNQVMQAIPVSQIESIEVIKNPDAKL